jgi:succinate dehydrogenase hydrophobic anchor subunit
MLQRMFQKREKGYKAMGYEITYANNFPQSWNVDLSHVIVVTILLHGLSGLVLTQSNMGAMESLRLIIQVWGEPV